MHTQSKLKPLMEKDAPASTGGRTTPAGANPATGRLPPRTTVRDRPRQP